MMTEKWNYVIYLFWVSYLILSAILMFGDGFLLSRKTLSDVSECMPLQDFGCDGNEKANANENVICSREEKIHAILRNPGSPMICAPSHSKVVLLMVDALRYDFTDYDSNNVKPLPYQNRIPVIRGTLKRSPNRSRLFRFIADPPTTTLQRVKALLTGSLPTFIDVTSNFAAIELQEDNTIEQVTRSGGNAVLLGDDTWARLLPGKWLRSYGLYSFHTWDLDTVDTEVDSKIYDELMKDDWNLLVAHYLGVDHAGHRYGPNHPEMSRKLDETNVRIQKIIEMLPKDVILYVIGDHGMTETGDHGGESKMERTAALFAYCSMGFYGNTSANLVGMEVRQTDFAATLSAALGRPPPAPSLGNILMSLQKPMTVPEVLVHLTNNLKQVTEYLIRYGEESQQISPDRLASLINSTRQQIQKAYSVVTTDDLARYNEDVRLLLDNVHSVFREVWVEFDSLSMLRALLLLLIAIFFIWLIAEGIPIESIPQIFASSFVPTGLISMAFCIVLCYTAFYLQMLQDLKHAIILSTGLVSGTLNCALVVMHWDGITQRWYEGRSPFYERFARCALFASAAVLVSNSYIIEEGAGLSFLSLSVLTLMVWNTGTVKSLLLWLSLAVSLVLSRFYRGCREEQGDCWTEGKGILTGQASRGALLSALTSVAAIVAITRHHIGWRGYGVVTAGLLICAHFAVGWGSLGSPSRSRQLARYAWLVIGSMFASLWRRESGAVLPVTVCCLLLYLANTLVLGVTFAPTAALALLTGYLAASIISSFKNEGATKFSVLSRSSSGVASMWTLLASYHFYGTGHHATLGHVRWAPAFHSGDLTWLPLQIGPALSGALVALDLFGMPLMFGVAVPLLALQWPSGGVAPGRAMGPRTQLAAVFVLCLKFALCFSIRVFVCALAATIHCRHLMIWGVFTPKLLFESASCGAALLGATLGAALAGYHTPLSHRHHS